MSEPLILTYYSSRTEDLIEALLQYLNSDLQSPIHNPFGQSTIVVPNSGMQRYLELNIAERFGICSHINIGYVGQLLSQTYQTLLGDASPTYLDERLLTFALLRLWDKSMMPIDSAFTRLLDQHQQPRQRYLFAQQVAKRLRSYLNERPEMIDAWQSNRLQTQNPHEPWQRDMLKQLFTALHISYTSRLDLQSQFKQALATTPAALTGDIHVFGFHAIPKTQLEELLAISQATQIISYTFNPSIEYWLDIVPETLKNRLEITKEDEAELLSVGHPLLASWGQSGKYYIEQLNEFYAPNLDEMVAMKAPASILDWVQQDIRELGSANNIAGELFAQECEQQQYSISLHCCANPRREIEVLYDNLCQYFETSEIKPNDVLVIVPQLNLYAPHIQAVFARSYDQQIAIPFSLAHQSSAESDADVQAFLSLLDVIDGDFQSQLLFEVLSEESIQQRLNLTQSHLDNLRHWFMQSRFSRHFFDNSQGASSSLEKLLDSLLLAAIGGEDTVLGNRHAASSYSDEQREPLMQLCQLWQNFLPFVRLKEQKLSLADWRNILRQLADTFLPQQHTMDNWLTQWYDGLAGLDDKAKFTFDTILVDLSTLLQNDTLHGPFLSGGVSFCAMAPMRSIPAKMMAILGLNSDFPNILAKDPLDLRKEQPRWSDRNPHKEQQYFFLETLMATRKKLYLSHVGLDDRTGEVIPPSALVSELFSYIERHITDFSGTVTTHYPLQGFVSENSYQTLYNTPSKTQLPASNTATSDRIAINLPDTLTARQLSDILLEPLSAFLCYNLGAESLDTTLEVLAEHEFIAAEDGLDKWHYQQSALAQAQEDHTNILTSLQQRNLYAPPMISQALLSKAHDDITPLLEALSTIDLSTKKVIEEMFKYRFEGASVYLHIKVDDFDDCGLLNYHTGKLTPKKYLTTWILHVLYHALPNTAPVTSTLISVDKKLHFNPFPDQQSALSALDELLRTAHLIIQKPYLFALQFSNKKAETIMQYNPVNLSLYPKLEETEIADYTDLDKHWKVVDMTIDKYAN